MEDIDGGLHPAVDGQSLDDDDDDEKKYAFVNFRKIQVHARRHGARMGVVWSALCARNWRILYIFFCAVQIAMTCDE